MVREDLEEIVSMLGGDTQLLSGKSILLTGARGFLGRYLTSIFKMLNETVLDKPVQIIALDNLITAGAEGFEIPKISNIQFITHDVIEPFNCSENIDYVIHAAGIASPYYYRAYPLETLQVAITGTQNMLELARQKNARLTFFSSSEIYGDPDSKHVP